MISSCRQASGQGRREYTSYVFIVFDAHFRHGVPNVLGELGGAFCRLMSNGVGIRDSSCSDAPLEGDGIQNDKWRVLKADAKKVCGTP